MLLLFYTEGQQTLAKGQSPPQELEESLRSGLYLLVAIIGSLARWPFDNDKEGHDKDNEGGGNDNDNDGDNDDETDNDDDNDNDGDKSMIMTMMRTIIMTV